MWLVIQQDFDRLMNFPDLLCHVDCCDRGKEYSHTLMYIQYRGLVYARLTINSSYSSHTHHKSLLTRPTSSDLSTGLSHCVDKHRGLRLSTLPLASRRHRPLFEQFAALSVLEGVGGRD